MAATRPENVSAEELPRIIQPVILGADYSAYAYIRAFWEAYHVRPIVVGRDDIKAVSKSRFCDYRVMPGIDHEDHLMEVLGQLGTELCEAGRLAFLVGCGDFYARIISREKDTLEQWFYTPYIAFELLDYITQKENFYKVCDECGIAYPMTRLFDCADPSVQMDDTGFRYPLVAKPSNSAAYHYAEMPDKRKVFYVESRDELLRIFDNFQRSNYDHDLILQEFIPGGDDQLHAVYAYANRHSDPVFLIDGHVALEDHYPEAIGNAVAIVPEHNEGVLEPAARFMKHVGYTGMGCFDAKYDQRDGTYRFLEMNTRPGRSSWLVLLSGINYAKLMVEDVVLGVDPEPVTPRDDWAYLAVPQAVIRRYVPESPLKDRLMAAYGNGQASFPMGWREDSLAQRFWADVNYQHQVQKFRRYFHVPEDKNDPSPEASAADGAK